MLIPVGIKNALRLYHNEPNAFLTQQEPDPEGQILTEQTASEQIPLNDFCDSMIESSNRRDAYFGAANIQYESIIADSTFFDNTS